CVSCAWLWFGRGAEYPCWSASLCSACARRHRVWLKCWYAAGKNFQGERRVGSGHRRRDRSVPRMGRGQIISIIREPRSRRQPERRDAAARAVAFDERERAAVVFGDLAAEHQTDATALRLGREEGHEQIGRVRDAGAVVVADDFDGAGTLRPRESHAG